MDTEAKNLKAGDRILIADRRRILPVERKVRRVSAGAGVVKIWLTDGKPAPLVLPANARVSLPTAPKIWE